jgi:hypothetical protein
MTSPAIADRKYRVSWFMKFAESLFAAIAILNAVSMALEVAPRKFLMFFGGSFFNYVLFGQVLLGLLSGIAFSIYWHQREKKNSIRSDRIHAWFRGILRYWLALEISTYGFAKILKTQFAVAYFRDDWPVGHLDGFNLTWNYYAHSYALAVIIALFQIGGSILLLFRRTTLLGVFVLLPVMVNIVFINFFYDIAAGAFVNSVLFTLGLFYLLMLDRPALQKVILKSGTGIAAVGAGPVKYLVRVMIIAGAFGFIYYLASLRRASPLAGKWVVGRLIRNGDTLGENAWLKDTAAWTTLYMEDGGDVAFCPNPYVYDDDKSVWASYQYDSAQHRLQLIFTGRSPKKDDTVIAAISHYDGSKMQVNGVIGKDSLVFLLTKAKKGG